MQGSAHEIDRRARAVASEYLAPRRPAVLAAAGVEQRMWFRRLGYRTQGDYAGEELGTSARSLRRLTCLGKRLAALPTIREAFSTGALPQTKAEALARVATNGTEDRWLAVADHLTVHELNMMVRAHLRSERETTSAEATKEATSDACASIEWCVEVPGWMIGKAGSVLRLVEKVAGTPLPQGTRWEFVAAEFLSGASVAGSEEAGAPEPPADPGRLSAVQADSASALPDLDPRTASTTPNPPAPPSDLLATPSSIPSSSTRSSPAACPTPHRPTPWELHDALKDAWPRGGQTALTLGALLRRIRDRNLWHALGAGSFDTYVSRRLGLSPRTARRLIATDAAAQRHPALRKACLEGRLSPLKTSALIRILDLGVDAVAVRAWIDYACRMTLSRLTEAADRACALAAADPQWAQLDGAPPHPSDRPTEQSPVARPKLATFSTSTLRLWLSKAERHTLELAVKGVRDARGPDWPLWACLNDLLDHFAGEYEDPAYRALSRHDPVLVRDDWRCQAPGCRARSGLHVHHITPRGVGGPNSHDNLIVVCNVHHLMIHRGWVRCRGSAPDAIRWTFGQRGHDLYIRNGRFHEATENEPRRVPIARFLSNYRLEPEEFWREVERRLVSMALTFPI